MEGSNMSPGEDSGIGFKISSEVMVAAVIFLFLVVIFVFFLYLYAKKYWSSSLTARSRAHFVFAAGDAPIPGRGLDVSVIRSLPVTVFKRSDFKDGLECSVCLCELSDGEEARLLPKCNHGFHLNCIDMWFHSHSTCPICRCAVGQEASPATGEELPPLTTGSAIDGAVQPESPAFPTNVLFWGNQDRVNTGGSFPQQIASGPSPNSARTLVISLPNRMLEGFPSPISPLPSSRFPSDNLKSPVEEARSPGASNFRSLRRLWSRGKRTNGSSCSSPMGGDIEQGLMGYGIPNGEGSSNVPKTPTGSFSPVALR